MYNTYDFLVADLDEMQTNETNSTVHTHLRLLSVSDHYITFFDGTDAFCVSVDLEGNYEGTWVDNLGNEHVKAVKIENN